MSHFSETNQFFLLLFVAIILLSYCRFLFLRIRKAINDRKENSYLARLEREIAEIGQEKEEL